MRWPCREPKRKLEATVKDDEQTRALLAILKLGEAEIREGRFSDVDEFLSELEQDSDRGEDAR
ncbi:hypothetical protein AWB80_01317 [Caballeronia pedi]|uniref:Uncharacterized protein n=1 Tax=Caballeronia pedi TaxID=1777141 RepID=A0A157ZUR2_9BURK|nr:hypothetical protein AWB80_01317 [Caballeronia pedi]